MSLVMPMSLILIYPNILVLMGGVLKVEKSHVHLYLDCLKVTLEVYLGITDVKQTIWLATDKNWPSNWYCKRVKVSFIACLHVTRSKIISFVSQQENRGMSTETGWYP